MAATLTDAMKSDLHLGNAELKIALWSDTALTATTFTDADSIFTVKDTLAITEGTPTYTSLKLDQLNETYAAPLTDKGDSTIAATIPFNAMELFEYFYVAAGVQPTATGVAPLVIDGESYTPIKYSNNDYYRVEIPLVFPKEIDITIDEYIRFEDIVQPYPTIFELKNVDTNVTYTYGSKLKIGSEFLFDKWTNL